MVVMDQYDMNVIFTSRNRERPFGILFLHRSRKRNFIYLLVWPTGGCPLDLSLKGCSPFFLSIFVQGIYYFIEIVIWTKSYPLEGGCGYKNFQKYITPSVDIIPFTYE